MSEVIKGDFGKNEKKNTVSSDGAEVYDFHEEKARLRGQLLHGEFGKNERKQDIPTGGAEIYDFQSEKQRLRERGAVGEFRDKFIPFLRKKFVRMSEIHSTREHLTGRLSGYGEMAGEIQKRIDALDDQWDKEIDALFNEAGIWVEFLQTARAGSGTEQGYEQALSALEDFGNNLNIINRHVLDGNAVLQTLQDVIREYGEKKTS